MPNSKYYREQARILSDWALAARNPQVASQLTMRAQKLLELAERMETAVADESANDVFHASQRERQSA